MMDTFLLGSVLRWLSAFVKDVRGWCRRAGAFVKSQLEKPFGLPA